MKKSSIHIRPVKKTSERHNRREMKLDYVQEDLSHKNESWQSDTVKNRRKEIEEKYKSSVKQKMQKKATPIREGVFLFKPDTTMEDCKKLSSEIEKKFGIRTFQIHLHRDEGHQSEDGWKPNLHGHLLFDWTDQDTGKTVKLNKDDMSEMQTLVAETLGMERGESSDKKHLTALQWKNKMEKEKELKIKAKISDLSALQDKAKERNNTIVKALKKNRKLSEAMEGKMDRAIAETIRESAIKTVKEFDETLTTFKRELQEEEKPKQDPLQKRSGGFSL